MGIKPKLPSLHNTKVPILTSVPSNKIVHKNLQTVYRTRKSSLLVKIGKDPITNHQNITTQSIPNMPIVLNSMDQPKYLVRTDKFYSKW